MPAAWYNSTEKIPQICKQTKTKLKIFTHCNPKNHENKNALKILMVSWILPSLEMSAGQFIIDFALFWQECCVRGWYFFHMRLSISISFF